MVVTLSLVSFLNIGAQSLIIGDIRFEGGEPFGTTRLIDWCMLKPGMSWQPDLAERANQRLVSNMKSSGYLLARIDSIAVLMNRDSTRIDLTWYIREDLPFELSTIDVTSDSISRDKFLEVMDTRTGDRYDRSRIETDLAAFGRVCAEEGFPFAVIAIGEPIFLRGEDVYETNIKINIKCGKRVRLEFIRIDGNTVTDEIVVMRELDIKPGDLYQQSLIDRIPDQLNRMGYFKNISLPKLLSIRNQQKGLLITLEEGNTTTFDGVVGYVPPAQAQGVEQGYFTGLINLNFRNLFGTGRRFQVDWKKPDRFSDEFRLYYEEPWIFGIPLNVGAGLHRLVRDTTFIERSYLLNGLVRLSGNFRVNFALNHHSYNPDSLASREQRLARNRIISGELGIIYDTRDYPVNPRRGLYYDTFYSFGFKQNLGPEYLFDEDGLPADEDLQRLRITMEYILPLWTNQVLYLKLMGGQVKSSADRLQLTDHFWFGGARTVRGYREDQFHGTTVAYVNLEYRFIAGRDARVFAFNDWGFYAYEDQSGVREDIVSGIGIGVRFNTPLGVMGVDFGMGRGDTFSTGKIHVGLINNF